MERLAKIIPQFSFEGVYEKAEQCHNGHINDTFILKCRLEDGTIRRYVLQYINDSVFNQPKQVMENIEAVTNHLQAKVKERGGDPTREALQIVPTKAGKPYYLTPENDYWRAYHFIEGAQTYQIVENPMHFYHAGRAFGQFQALLSDFPAHTLHETIVQFHDTRKRFHDFLQVVKKDPVQRVKDVSTEISFILDREADTGVVVDLIDQNKLPLRVIHNDTKFNNIMIDDETGEGICVLDLDTVMPGTILYDFGDAIRFGASTALEDEQNLDLVWLDLDLFTAFTKGYLSIAQDFLSPTEVDYLAFSAKLLTLETGIRFLTDYLNGDQYFRVAYSRHNLDRARTQLKLVADMEHKMQRMEEVIRSLVAEQRGESVV